MPQLIGGLADEKVRWAESVSTFDAMLVNMIGDVMVSAGVVAYLGPFTVSSENLVHCTYEMLCLFSHLHFILYTSNPSVPCFPSLSTHANLIAPSLPPS